MMDIPFVGGRDAGAGCASWARSRCSGSRWSGPFFRRARRVPGRSRRNRPQGAARLDRDAASRRGARACSRRAPASTDRRSSRCSPGAAYLALRAGVPIVPVGIGGHRGDPAQQRPELLPRFGRVAVVVGEPIDAAGRCRRARVPRDRSRRADGAAGRRAAGWRSTTRTTLRGSVERSRVSRRGRRAPSTRRRRGRRRTRPPSARGRGRGSPPNASAATASSAGTSSRSSRRRREVLVLVGDVHGLDAVARVRAARSPPRRGPRARSRPR